MFLAGFAVCHLSKSICIDSGQGARPTLCTHALIMHGNQVSDNWSTITYAACIDVQRKTASEKSVAETPEMREVRQRIKVS